MATAKELFYNSYLKKLKRPEFQREYNPDDTYGANSVMRSERTNPWAGRDSSNAKFGFLGGNNQGGGDQGEMNQSEGLSLMSMIAQGQGGSLPSGTFGMPAMQPQQRGPLGQAANMAGGIATNVGSKYATNAILDWLNNSGGSGKEALADMPGGYTKLLDSMTSKGSDAFAESVYGAEGAADALSSGSSAASGAASGAAGGAMSGAVPVVGAGLKLGTDALTGKLQKRPGSSVGSAAGGAIGATAGTAIFPGVGTVIGGVAGSMIGDKIGTIADEGLSWDSISNALKPPDTNPMSMIKGIFGGGGEKSPPLKSTEEMNALLKPSGGLGGLGGEGAQTNSMLDILNGENELLGAFDSEGMWDDLFSNWQFG